MQKLAPVLTLTIGLGLVIGTLWILQKNRGEPEVVKIYKATPYQPKPVTPVQAERADTFIDVSTGVETELPDALETRDAENTSTEEFSPEEEAALWEWLSLLEEAPEEKAAQAPETEENEVPELTGGEIEDMVLEAYQLLDILDEYGVTFDPYDGEGTCPFCLTPEKFQVIHNGSTGRPDYWSCQAPYCGDNGTAYYPYNLIDFVAKMEGMDEYQAARYLAERKGLLE